MAGFKRALILCAIGMFNNGVVIGSEAVAVVHEGGQAQQKAISLAILYHKESHGAGENKDFDIDNGALPDALATMVEKKIPAILVNGVIAYPLVFTTIVGYGRKQKIEITERLKKLSPQTTVRAYVCSSFGASWNIDLCSSDFGSAFLTDYTPYLVKASAKTLSDERFVLFVRNDAPYASEQVFNMERLQSFDVRGPDMLDKVFTLLTEIKNHHENSRTLASTMTSIFNTSKSSKERYSWNIFIKGHGNQLSQKDVQLLARGMTSVKRKDTNVKTEDTNVKTEDTSVKREDTIAIANMPPRQFGMLLDFFNTMPVNIVLLNTCYSGGYNASLMEQELRFLTTLTTRALLSPEKLEQMQKEMQSTTGEQITPEQLLKQAIVRVRHKHHRPYILVSLSAFDDLTYGGDIGSWLNSFDELFNKKPRSADEELKKLIKNILKRSCDGTPIILMPESDKFELLAGPECVDELFNALAKSPKTLQRSIDLMEEYVQKDEQKTVSFAASRKMIDLFKRYAIGDDSANTIEKIVNKLIEHKTASTDSRTWLRGDSDGQAALLLTLRLGRDDLGLSLLRYGADANVKDDKGNSVLILELQKRFIDIELIKALLDHGADANVKDDKGNPALIVAVKEGLKVGWINIKLIKALLDHGADANVKDDKGNSVLILDLQKRFIDIELIKALLDNNADVNAKDDKGNSALILAVQKKNEIFVQDLLEKEANLNATNFDGMTALMFAVINNMPDIVQKLLDRGADADVRDLKNHTALAYAIEAPNSKLIEALLDKTADINVQDKNGYTGLMVAIRENQSDLVDKFLARNAKVNIKDNYGNTALMHAIMREISSVVGKLLTVHDIDVSVQNNTGETALMLAVSGGNTLFVQKLLDKGADVNVQDKRGDSAKNIVQRYYYGNEEIKKMIMSVKKAQEDDDILFDLSFLATDTADVEPDDVEPVDVEQTGVQRGSLFYRKKGQR